jgi:hypothetical protein
MLLDPMPQPLRRVVAVRGALALLEAEVGVAMVPRSVSVIPGLRRVPVDELEPRRTVYLYSVAGRQRMTVASIALKLLRSSNWFKVRSAFVPSFSEGQQLLMASADF